MNKFERALADVMDKDYLQRLKQFRESVNGLHEDVKEQQVTDTLLGYYGSVTTVAGLADAKYLLAPISGFHVSIQQAYNKKIPALLYYKNDPELLVQSGMNPSKWADAQNQDLQNILAALFVGPPANKAMRAVHGIVLDCNKIKQNDGKYLTANWVFDTATHLIERLKFYAPGVPVFVQINGTTTAHFEGQDINARETMYNFVANNLNGWFTIVGSVVATTSGMTSKLYNMEWSVTPPTPPADDGEDDGGVPPATSPGLVTAITALTAAIIRLSEAVDQK
jgi:hypothetical protein